MAPGWVEIDEMVKESDIFACYPLPRASHGICECCKTKVMAELNKLTRQIENHG